MIKPNAELKKSIVRLTAKVQELHPYICDVFERLPEYKGLFYEDRTSSQGSVILKLNEVLDTFFDAMGPLANEEFKELTKKAGLI